MGNIKRAIVYRILHARIQSFFDKYSTSYIMKKLNTTPQLMVSLIYLVLGFISLFVKIFICFYNLRQLINLVTILCLAVYGYMSKIQSE